MLIDSFQLIIWTVFLGSAYLTIYNLINGTMVRDVEISSLFLALMLMSLAIILTTN